MIYVGGLRGLAESNLNFCSIPDDAVLNKPFKSGELILLLLVFKIANGPVFFSFFIGCSSSTGMLGLNGA